MFTFATKTEPNTNGNQTTIKRADKIERMQRAGWHVRYTSDINRYFVDGEWLYYRNGKQIKD